MAIPTPVLAGAALVALLVVGVVAIRARRRRAGVTQPEVAPDTDPQPQWQEPPPATVADAVTRALAAREARGGDARDRLLAVLLADPARAVGATVELDACRRQLDRLSGAVEHERAALRGVLRRLAATGLSDDQLARLAGVPADELRGLLGRV